MVQASVSYQSASSHYRQPVALQNEQSKCITPFSGMCAYCNLKKDCLGNKRFGVNQHSRV